MKKKTPKQIAALVCVVILVLMYLISFVVAIFNFDSSGRMLQACIVATIALPILLWIYIWLYGMMKGKHTIASLDIMQDPDTVGKQMTENHEETVEDEEE